MKLLDTNFILRFLLQDLPNQFLSTKKIIQNIQEDLAITDVTLAEVVWVLTSFYKFSKEETANKIYNLINLPNITTNKQIIIMTIFLYREFPISFVDAYQIAYAAEEKLEGIYSFDKGLDKIKDVKRFEPK